MKNSIVLFDIDYTLFDVGKYKETVFAKIASLLPQYSDMSQRVLDAYKEIRKTGPFDPNTFTKELLSHIATDMRSEEFSSLWTEKSTLLSCIYEEVLPVLNELSNKEQITLGIFSSGKEFLQKAKIETLLQFFHKQHVHIYDEKDKKLEDMLHEYKEKKVYLIDDYLEVLEKAKEIKKDIITIWMKRGQFAENISPSVSFKPDAGIDTLSQLPEIIASI